MNRIVGAILLCTLFMGLALSAPTAPTPAEINQAVVELGHADGEVRDQAEGRLWKWGDVALRVVAKAADSDDPEVRIRARGLWQRIAMNLRPDTPKEKQEMALEYLKASSVRKTEIFLAFRKDLPLLCGLARVEKERELHEGICATAFVISSKTARAAIRKGNYEEAESILNMAASTLDMRSVRNWIAFLVVAKDIGIIPDRPLEKPPANAGPDDWRVYALMARAKGDMAEAVAAARKTDDDDLLLSILIETGDWKGLLKELAGEQDKVGHVGAGATLYGFLGNEAESRQALAQLRKLTSGKKDDATAQALATVFMANGLVGESLAALADADDRDMALAYALDHGRFEQFGKIMADYKGEGDEGLAALSWAYAAGDKERALTMAHAMKGKWPPITQKNGGRITHAARALHGLGFKKEAEAHMRALAAFIIKQLRENFHETGCHRWSGIVAAAAHDLGYRDIGTAIAAQYMDGPLLGFGYTLTLCTPKLRNAAELAWRILRRRNPNQPNLERLKESLALINDKKKRANLILMLQAKPENGMSAREWGRTSNLMLRAADELESKTLADMARWRFAVRPVAGKAMTRILEELGDAGEWDKALKLVTKALATASDIEGDGLRYDLAAIHFAKGNKKMGRALRNQAWLLPLADTYLRRRLITSSIRWGEEENQARHWSYLARFASMRKAYRGQPRYDDGEFQRLGYPEKELRFVRSRMIRGILWPENRPGRISFLFGREQALLAELYASRGNTAKASAMTINWLGKSDWHAFLIAETLIPVLDAQGKSAEADKLFRPIFAALKKSALRTSNGSLTNRAAWFCVTSKREVADGLKLAKRYVDRHPLRSAMQSPFLDTLAYLYHLSGNQAQALSAARLGLDIEEEPPTLHNYRIFRLGQKKPKPHKPRQPWEVAAR
jgi:hypothetical protein